MVRKLERAGEQQTRRKRCSSGHLCLEVRDPSETSTKCRIDVCSPLA